MADIRGAYGVRGMLPEVLFDEVFGPVDLQDIQDWVIANAPEDIILTPEYIRRKVLEWKGYLDKFGSVTSKRYRDHI